MPAIRSRIVEWSSRRIHVRTRARPPVDPVVERADAEHRRQRGRVDPGRDQLAPRVGEGHEHDAGDERRRRTRTGGRPRAAAASLERPRRNCALHSFSASLPVGEDVEAGIGGHARLPASVWIHGVELEVGAEPVGRERDPRAVGRPGRCAVLARSESSGATLPAVLVHRVDLEVRARHGWSRRRSSSPTTRDRCRLRRRSSVGFAGCRRPHRVDVSPTRAGARERELHAVGRPGGSVSGALWVVSLVTFPPLELMT